MRWLEHTPKTLSIVHRDDDALLHGHSLQISVEYGSEDYEALLKLDVEALTTRLAQYDKALIVDRSDPDLNYLAEYLGEGFARIVPIENSSLPGLAAEIGTVADKLAAGLTRGRARATTCRCLTADGEVGIWRHPDA